LAHCDASAATAAACGLPELFHMISEIRDLFISVFLRIEKETADFVSANRRFDARVALIILVALTSLIFTQYFAVHPGYRMLVDVLKSLNFTEAAQQFTIWIDTSGNVRIHRLMYWVGIILISYVGLPVLCVKFILRQKLRDFGLGIGSSSAYVWLYALMMLVMLPVVFFISKTPSFLHMYPFYKLTPGESLYPYFWIWQALYFVQFICIEFFFRGFLLHGLKQRFGYYAVLLMAIPYCMIHFGKPMPEAFSAIVAAVILGTLSLHSRSIWMGVLVHFSVAVTMDIAAVWRLGLLG
jgi:uncharacterized protein